MSDINNINWKQYKIVDPLHGYNQEKFLKFININNPFDVKYINNKLKAESIIDKKTDEVDLYQLSKSKFGHNLYALYMYLKNKIHYVKHILQINDTIDNEDLSLYLQIYEKIDSNIEWLDKIHLYYTFATRKQEKSYIADKSFELNDLTKILSESYIKQKIITDSQFSYIYKSFTATSEYILGIYFPSNNERLAEAFSGPITYSPKESFIIYYDKINNNFIFRGATKYENRFKDSIEKELNINLIEWGEAISFDSNKFMKRLQQKPNQSNIALTALHINGLALGKNINILLSQAIARKSDIASKIYQLISTKAIEINSFKDINYLKVFYKIPEKNNYKEREINVTYDPSNTKVKLMLDNKDLIPLEKSFLIENFEQEFGIPLEKTLKPELFQNGIIDLYKHILLKNMFEDLDTSVLNLFEKLKNTNIITLEENNLWYCENCNTYNEVKFSKCQSCEANSTNMKQVSTYTINEEKVIELILKIFQDQLPKYQIVSEIKKHKYTGFIIRDENNNEINIILSINKLTINNIKKLKAESKAIVFILSNQNSSIDNQIIQNELFSYIPLELILAYNDIADNNFINDYICNACTECIKKANIQAEIETLNSINIIKNDYETYKNANNKGDLFENDVYNILRYIFKTTKQLGKTAKGKKVPDGYFDIHITSGAGVRAEKKYTLMWDAKFSQLEKGYDFTISEKRKIAEYLEKYSKEYEISNFSSQTTLDIFIIIYNKASVSRFNDIAKSIREQSSWTGKLVFFDILALVEIVDFIIRNQNDFESKNNIFKFDFIEKLLEINNINENNHVIIDNKKALDFIRDFNRKTSTIQTINDIIEE